MNADLNAIVVQEHLQDLRRDAEAVRTARPERRPLRGELAWRRTKPIR
jgi:hypothetical protein